MRKVLSILFILLSFFSYAGEIETRECLEQWNIRNIGIREESNKNDGEFVKYVLSNCHLGEGYAYCGCYVFTGFLDCKFDRSKLPLYPAWSPSWYVEKKTVYFRGLSDNYRWKVGDIFSLFSEKDGRIIHVGYVMYVNIEGGYVLTAEGNTLDSGNEWNIGEGVHLRKRSLKQIYAVMDYISNPEAEVMILYHYVEKKETLYRIAQNYKVTVNQLLEWNPDITNNIIHLNQKLIIKKCV